MMEWGWGREDVVLFIVVFAAIVFILVLAFVVAYAISTIELDFLKVGNAGMILLLVDSFKTVLLGIKEQHQQEDDETSQVAS